MLTLCKTSLGGFNLNNVTQWTFPENGTLRVWFNAPDGMDDPQDRIGQDCCEFEGNEAQRVLKILNDVCIFDATLPKRNDASDEQSARLLSVLERIAAECTCPACQLAIDALDAHKAWLKTRITTP